MSGNFDSEQWQNFNERLSRWISKQGLWFQFRHSLLIGDRNGNYITHFVHRILRFGLFSMIAALLWVGVVKMTGGESFRELVIKNLQEKFSAKEIEVGSMSRARGKFTIGRLALIDEENSFFRGLELSNLICQKDFFVDFGKTWRPGIVQISKVNLLLRAGADTDEGAEAIGNVLFQDLGNSRPDAIHVASMSMKWGYTESSRGSVTGSQMKAVPVADGWRLSFRGGTFSQNWLKNLQIQELDVLITRKGILFEKAIFSKNEGSLVFDQLEVKSGQRPLVSGHLKMKGLDISGIVPMAARAYIEGKISGEFTINGSTNSTEGIGFDGVVELDKGDVITLRDRIPMLRALSVVDANRNYRRVDFRAGSFRMEMQGKGLMISDIKLIADDTMSLFGGMVVRKPKSDEELVLDDGSEFFGRIAVSNESIEDVNLSLREAGELVNRNNMGFQEDGNKSLFKKLATLRASSRLREFESEKLSRSYRYEGEVNVTLMKTAFDRVPELKQAYPPASGEDRILIPVPIKGLLYEVTSELADIIYEKAKK
jgi:hypothetical protein